MKRLDVYKCGVCGNIVEVEHVGGGTLVCCDQDMTLLEEKSADSSTEKHVPVIENIAGGYKVTVGSTLHPMKEEHYIEWIELITETETLITFLNPGDEPVAIFKTDEKAIKAREYCNLHGLWKNEL
ncbi:desulfoferrodoxin [Fusibacter sp. 3D3]|uniref:desulfoferrodoxin n=1 Tax=Fusibacter sp. 3D3 TaxID=1048380 RepID=UPI000852B31F|nr:desulfoferrodoxin [Fusibacter sp. 3D3]GAU76188.1 superoxide reductase [Fusibacter sp. 3D3]